MHRDVDTWAGACVAQQQNRHNQRRAKIKKNFQHLLPFKPYHHQDTKTLERVPKQRVNAPLEVNGAFSAKTSLIRSKRPPLSEQICETHPGHVVNAPGRLSTAPRRAFTSSVTAIRSTVSRAKLGVYPQENHKKHVGR